jgi:hypothetical protein
MTGGAAAHAPYFVSMAVETFILPRHCERSEAIQFKKLHTHHLTNHGLPRGVPPLAMTRCEYDFLKK